MATTSTHQALKIEQRTYHDRKDAAYVLPNDAAEHARLEAQAAHLSAIMNNNPIHAPISPSTPSLRILDVGCGTGIISDYLGHHFPTAHILGLDISPVPPLRGHPPNVHFLQGNVLADAPQKWTDRNGEAPLVDGKGSFDFIFSRLLVCGMSDWDRYIRTTYDLLKPGGWVEIQDVDFRWCDASGNCISDSWPWWQRVSAAGTSTGLDWECGRKAAQRLREAGFVDVEVTTYRCPYGGEWEEDPVYREFGRYVAREIVPLTWHMVARLMGNVGAEEGEVRMLQEEAMQYLKPEEGKHWVYYVTVGRKPE